MGEKKNKTKKHYHCRKKNINDSWPKKKELYHAGKNTSMTLDKKKAITAGKEKNNYDFWPEKKENKTSKRRPRWFLGRPRPSGSLWQMSPSPAPQSSVPGAEDPRIRSSGTLGKVMENPGIFSWES